MQVLSYGYSLPETGDKGAPLFTALEDNIQRLNDHTHSGTDSAQLTAVSIVGIPQTIAAGSWVANGPTGFYRQLVTVPAGFDFDTVAISFRLAAGQVVYPTVERQSDTQYYVYTIDNSLALIAVYGG